MRPILITVFLTVTILSVQAQKIDLINLRRLSLSTTADQWEAVLHPIGFKLENTYKKKNGEKNYEYYVYKKLYFGTSGKPNYYDMIALIREADKELYLATEFVRYYTYDEQQFVKLKTECTSNVKATLKKEQSKDNCLERIYTKDLYTYSFQNCTQTDNGYNQYIIQLNYNVPF